MMIRGVKKLRFCGPVDLVFINDIVPVSNCMQIIAKIYKAEYLPSDLLEEEDLSNDYHIFKL